MMQLRTEVQMPEVSKKLTYRQNSMMIGSCFAENIGNRLQQLCFPIKVNPYGILYNPSSIASALEFIIEQRQFSEKDIFFHNGLWNSFHHHGSFSSPDKTEVLTNINRSNSEAYQFIKCSSHLFITFGTSWVFANKADGIIVGNCHKLPDKHFDRYQLSVAAMVEKWIKTIENVVAINPEIHIVLTISPIRHLKDGAFENQVSKSALFLMVSELVDYFGKERITYFPSYELMMDELRDYRFYASDMTHPSETGIEFIREKFEEVFIDQESKKIRALISKLIRNLEHRPTRPDEKNYLDFIKKTKEEALNLTSAYPFVNINMIIEAINAKSSKYIFI